MRALGLRLSTGIAASILLASATARAEHPPLRLITAVDGLAQDRVIGISTDSQGFVWFCTGSGLSRFDGKNFRTFGADEGLSYRLVNQMIEERPGRYWVATNGGGAFLFTPRSAGAATAAPRFHHVPVGKTPASNRVNVLARGRRGGLWLGSDDGLYLMPSTEEPSVIRRVAPPDSALARPLVQVWSLLEDGTGALWVGTSVGLFALLPDGRLLERSIRVVQAADHVWAIAEDADDGILIGHDAGVFRVRLDRDSTGLPSIQADRLQLPGTPLEDPVRGLLRSRDGRLWIAGAHGVSVLDGGQRHRVVDPDDLDGGAGPMAEDATGGIWVVRIAGGVARIARTGFAEYDVRDGLGDRNFGYIFRARSGELCASGRRYLNVFSRGAFTAIRPNLPLDVRGLGRSYGAALEDHLGDWWLPAGDGVYRFPPVSRIGDLATASPKAVYASRDGLAGTATSRIFEDSRGDLWLNTRIPGRGVVTRWDRHAGVFQQYGQADGLEPYNAVCDFAEDRAGAIWFGFFESGLARFRDGRFERVPGFESTGSTCVLHVDTRGRLWVGTLEGVRRIENPESSVPGSLAITAVAGVERLRAHAFVEDEQGRIFVNGGDEIVRLDADAPPQRISAPRGLRLDSPAAFRDRDGTLWLGTTQGVVTFSPDRPREQTRLSTRVGSLRVNGMPRAVGDLGEDHLQPLTLAPDERRLEIGFFALGPVPAEDVQFQYRLQGGGGAQDWSRQAPNSSVLLAGLASGRYTFEVRPVSGSGTVIGAPATVRFRVLPPVWARWWFLGLVALVIAVAGGTFHRRRVARALELGRIRMSIATDLHDDIGANLSQISLLSEVLRGRSASVDATATASLGTIADLARESVDGMSDIVWAIDPKNDRLTSLGPRMRRFMGELLSARDIEFTLDLDGSLQDTTIAADTRRDLYLAFKEALNNVVRHSGATRVEVALSIADGWIDLRIRDNGSGFDTGTEGAGHGMTSLKRRAERSGGRLDLTSAPGQGTTVRLRVPTGAHSNRWGRTRSERLDSPEKTDD